MYSSSSEAVGLFISLKNSLEIYFVDDLSSASSLSDKTLSKAKELSKTTNLSSESSTKIQQKQFFHSIDKSTSF